MKTLFALAGIPVICFLLCTDTVKCQKRPFVRTIVGSISAFECGDNCYLTIMDDYGKTHVGLCSARECDSWVDEAVLPVSAKGKRVKITVGRGTQFDGSGRAVGKMDAFTKIQYLPDTLTTISSDCRYCGTWKYTAEGNMFQGQTGYLRVSQEGKARFKLLTGFPDLAGQIEWTDFEIKNSNGIYLTEVGGKLTGRFVSPNFLPTRWQDYSYRITCALRSDGKMDYSVWSSPGAKAVGPSTTERFVATRIQKTKSELPKAAGTNSMTGTVIDNPTGICGVGELIVFWSAIIIKVGDERYYVATYDPCVLNSGKPTAFSAKTVGSVERVGSTVQVFYSRRAPDTRSTRLDLEGRPKVFEGYDGELTATRIVEVKE
ncbi:MAG: hypothetical protein IPG67_17880 [Acidobacteria bacterium]|nr:hypothetical protein [Acidobacteriota bacterium]MBK7935258.1 hypothetical protein [Acidobacteriota bacterium]